MPLLIAVGNILFDAESCYIVFALYDGSLSWNLSSYRIIVNSDPFPSGISKTLLSFETFLLDITVPVTFYV